MHGISSRELYMKMASGQTTEKNPVVYTYEFNEPLTKQYKIVLSNWCKTKTSHIHMPDDVNKLIMQYFQYASDFEETSAANDDNEHPHECTIRAENPFSLNKGKYSFTVTFKSTEDGVVDGDYLDGLNFVGICSDKYTAFDKYVLYSDRKYIYGFGDDMNVRGWVTWRYFGTGQEPQAWFECSNRSEPTYIQQGGFGHMDKISIVVDMDQGWIKGYKNGKRFIKNAIGDIRMDVTDELKFYPVVSVINTEKVECTLSFGNLKH